MISYAGMKAEESKSEGYGQLPAGPYVAVVLGVKIDGNAPDQNLIIQVDVSEGEYKDFFINKFTAAKKSGSQYGEVKYKGVYRLRIPHPQSSSPYPESDVRKFNDAIFRFEKSNPGFHWDGDEQKLKGLTVGINMQEDEYNGNNFTRIGRLETADDIRKGLVKAMNPRKRQQQTASPAETAGIMSGMMPVPNATLPDLPF